jgi:uncharacterized membrane protein YbhN (UPF0104 family)
MSGSAAAQMPDELSPRRISRRLLEVALVVVVIVVVVVVGPGLGTLRDRLEHASLGWLLVGVALEVLSALAYVIIFRAVFCPKMSWRLSYQIGMAEQGANSVLSVSGAGGLALGVWALRRGGMSAEYIGRRTVAFFLLTSLANISGVIIFAVLYVVGILHHDRDPALTYGFGVAALAATVLVLVLPRLLVRKPDDRPPDMKRGKLATAIRFGREALGQGIPDAVHLLGQRPIPILAGSYGTLIFDIAVLGVAFKAFGHSPPFGVLVFGYLIGQLGGNIPVPGGIGGVDAGLIGVFVLYHQPLAATTAAVLIYHAIVLWVPALLGSVAFVQLRNTLAREAQPAAMCAPLAEPIRISAEAMRSAASVSSS